MNRIVVFIVFTLFYQNISAQVLLNGSSSSKTISSLDSTGEELAKIKRIVSDSTRLLVFPVSNTSKKDTSRYNNNTCVIAFIGCDESRIIMSDFTNYFYTEYLKTSNSETAFYSAKQQLFKKYPDSPITPVLNCKK